MKNIVVYITYDGLTDPLGESQIIPYIQGLSQRGYVFHVISCEKPDRYKQHKQRILEKLIPYGITWEPVTFLKTPPIISSFLNLYRIYRSTKKLSRQYNIKLIHCRSYLSSLIGLKFKTQYGIPFLFDMRGFWIEERIEGGLWNMKNPLFKIIYKYLKNKEEDFFLQSDACISLTERGKVEICKRYKHKKDNIFIIPCSVSFDKFSIPSIPDIVNTKKRLGIPEASFVLSYSGSIGTWYMLDEMLDFYGVLIKKFPNAYFLILTSDDPIFLEKKALQKGLNLNQIIVKYFNREQMPAVISVSNLSVFFIRPTFSKTASSPTKLGELFALGIPIVCNKGIGDVDSVVEDIDGGLVLQHFSEIEYEKIITKITSVKYSKSDIRRNAERYYELSYAIDTYNKAYQNCIK